MNTLCALELYLPPALLLLFACGGSDPAGNRGSGGAGGSQRALCNIVDSVLILPSDSSCTLTTQQRATYRLQGGEPACRGGRVELGGLSGAQLELNGLQIRCEQLPLNIPEQGMRSPDGSGGGLGTGAAGGEGSPNVATIVDAGSGVAEDNDAGAVPRAEDAGSGGSSGDDATCVVLDESIVLAEGGSCRLSQQDQARYRLPAFDVTCNQGRVSADGISAAQLTFNGLQIRCAATLAG